MKNVYLEEYEKVKDTKDEFSARCELVRIFSWAIPNDEMISTICKHSPIVSIGCGTGYIERLVEDAGGDIIPTDYISLGKKSYGFMKQWMSIKNMKHYEAVRFYQHRNILMSWPCYIEPSKKMRMRDFAYQVAGLMSSGKILIYVGEGPMGCTGSDAFHDYLNNNFEYLEQINIPQWYGMHDCCEIYRKK